MKAIDVVVVGAGPVGLLTAIELTVGGVRVLVLERLAEASTAMKALSIGPLGSEALQRRGLAAALAAAEARSFAAMHNSAAQTGADVRGRGSKISGHFAGLSLIRRDAQKEPDRRARAVGQQDLEAMLADRARALGIEVRRACDITGFVQQGDGVDVAWASPTGEGPTGEGPTGEGPTGEGPTGEGPTGEGPTGGGRVRCAYLVGCDGGRSLIRKMAGFDFPGTPPTFTFYQAVAEIDHLERLLPIGWHRTSGGVFSYWPSPGRLSMLDFSGPPADRETPVTREELEAVLRRVSGADVRVKALESASRWADNTRLVDTYRRGRVLLAGDAAHVHSPFGGQGLNLGLVDAANLGWKLAAVVRGGMPDRLLDTYTAERRPAAEVVLANTRAQVALLRPDPQSGAMRDLVATLLQFDDVNRFIGELTSGLSTRYDLGSECHDRDDVGRLIGDRPVGHGGAGVPLYDVLQDGVGVLLDASSGGRASTLVTTTARRVRCVAVDTGPSMLIRPDACVAWAGEASSTDGLEDALHRWFEPPLEDGSMARSEP